MYILILALLFLLGFSAPLAYSGAGFGAGGGVQVGTTTDTKLCSWDATGNEIDCDSDPSAVGVDSIGTNELDDGADTPLSGEYIRVDTVDQAGVEYRTTAQVLSDIGAESATSNDIDPDRLAGDTVDDNAIDFGILASITVTDLASACTDAQVLGGDVAATGVECQADDDVPESGDFGAAGDLEADGTLSADVVAAAELADADLGDVSVSGGVVTLDNDVVAAAEMADADHGAISWSGGVASIDDDVISVAKIANGDWGDFTITTNVATIDNDAITDAKVVDTLTASNYVPLAGGVTIAGTNTFTGTIQLDGGTEGKLEVANSTTVPATCAVGELYVDTDADTEGSLMLCYATNTWKEVDDDGGAGGSGDITDVFNCATGDCNSIVMADGDLLNASGVNPNTTSEGIILPQSTDCSNATAEGQLCWDTDDADLRIGSGGGTIVLGISPPAEKTVGAPQAGDDVPFAYSPYGRTISVIYCLIDRDDTGENVNIDIREIGLDGDNDSVVQASIVCDNDGTKTTSFTDANLDADDSLVIDVNSVTGTVSQLTVTVWYN